MSVAVWLPLASSSAAAQVGLITRDEALAAVFPGAEVEAERVFLTADQTHRAAVLAGGAAPRALVARYVARRGREIVGRAYVDTHVVRTKRREPAHLLGFERPRAADRRDGLSRAAGVSGARALAAAV